MGASQVPTPGGNRPASEGEDRYARQSRLAGFGREGQDLLARARVVVVGCGATGCASLDMLARGGVGLGRAGGWIVAIDRDVVERSNLQRQQLFDESCVGWAKAEAVAGRVGAINSEVAVVPRVADFGASNARELVLGRGEPTLIVDGTDSIETRLLINDLAVETGTPWVYCGVVGTRGMVMPILPGRQILGSATPWPCLRCVARDAPSPGSMPTCESEGVLGPAVGIAASAAMAEAFKIMLGRTDLVNASLLEFDVWTNSRRRIAAADLRDPQCGCCVGRRFDFLLGDAGTSATTLCGGSIVQVMPMRAGRVDLDQIAVRLEASASCERLGSVLRATLRDERHDDGDRAVVLTIFGDGRTLVQGTRDIARARMICARYLGL